VIKWLGMVDILELTIEFGVMLIQVNFHC